ncbi:MAG TPA: PAS domain-containing protein, partial [Bacteroidales bacterium]|nr:PAS domain-containing protein [Bacteroidales bacterium]
MVQQNKRGQKKVSNFTDSEKISAQENIKMSSSNKNLQLIIKLSGTGTWEWNIQTGETIFNESWANMLGYKFEELMPTTIDTWTQMTHPDDLKIAQTALEKYFNKETAFYEAKFRMRHRNGNWVWVLDRGQVAEYTPDGKPLLMLGTHQNINKIKETEISLQLEEERLESLLRISQHQANTVQEL